MYICAHLCWQACHGCGAFRRVVKTSHEHLFTFFCSTRTGRPGSCKSSLANSRMSRQIEHSSIRLFNFLSRQCQRSLHGYLASSDFVKAVAFKDLALNFQMFDLSPVFHLIIVQSASRVLILVCVCARARTCMMQKPLSCLKHTRKCGVQTPHKYHAQPMFSISRAVSPHNQFCDRHIASPHCQFRNRRTSLSVSQ